MPKPKTIKLKAAEKKEADQIQRDITIARYGIETAQRLHFEAGERLWEYLRSIHPEIAANSVYHEGVITHRSKREKP